MDWLSKDDLPGGVGIDLALPWETVGAVEKRTRGDGVPWSKSFLSRAGGSFDPIGSFWKFISLTFIPLLFAAAGYMLFRGFMEWSEYLSLAVLLLVFFLVLSHSVKRLSERPSSLEVLKFCCQEAALVWLMWIFGSLIYTLCLNNLGIFSYVSTFAGLVTAGLTYFFAASRVERRTGARGLLRYLIQVGSVVAANFAGTVAGYFLAPVIWPMIMSVDCPPHGKYVVAMLSAFVSFWIAVNQFYIETGKPNGPTSPLERGTDMGIG